MDHTGTPVNDPATATKHFKRPHEGGLHAREDAQRLLDGTPPCDVGTQHGLTGVKCIAPPSAAGGTCVNAQNEVLAAEQQRAAAWIAGDTAALSAYLDDELVYIHATGVRHDREQLLEYLSTGPRFEGMRFQPRSFRLDGEVARVSGELHLRVGRGIGVYLELHSVVTAAWVRRGDRWRLASFRDTAILTGSERHPT